MPGKYLLNLLNDCKAMGEIENALGVEGARNYKLLRGIRVDFVEEVIFLDDL